MFRLGDFYELFYEDAVTAARELEITLTSRNKEKDQAYPMCGVPHHPAKATSPNSFQRGYRVAVCEQMEDPRFTKKLVQPGDRPNRHAGHRNRIESAASARENNYLAPAAIRNGRGGASPCRCLYRRVPCHGSWMTADAAPVLENLNARELLLEEHADLRGGLSAYQARLLGVRATTYSERSLREHFKLLSLDGCGLAGKPLAVSAAGAVLHYLRDRQRAALDHAHLTGPGTMTGPTRWCSMPLRSATWS